jgi:hypothetical protein
MGTADKAEKLNEVFGSVGHHGRHLNRQVRRGHAAALQGAAKGRRYRSQNVEGDGSVLAVRSES